MNASRIQSIATCAMAVLSAIAMRLLVPDAASAAGVTLIAHGYNSDVNGWVTGMADWIPDYYRFPGTNFTTYTVTVTYSGGYYNFSSSRTNGSPPLTTDSGEIIVKLDWSALGNDLTDSYASTYAVAPAVARALMRTDLIAELGGHALAEYPIHLIGHSRGGSLVSELSRDLGTNGVWVDQMTTLDPHPMNNDGNLDPSTYSDAPMHTYANVLFHDNYWENLNLYPHGEAVAGAYVRQLTSLSGGYSSAHSDVHLWYHGTIDLATPASDTEASLGGTQRTNWWVAYEDYGLKAGFYYSLIGGGDRLSTDQPLGSGSPAIIDGFNQEWDLGAGIANNRTALPANNGGWPNLIRFDRLDTNAVVQGQSASLMFYYQWAQPATNVATMKVYLDDDQNPFDTNEVLLATFDVPGTGSGGVGFNTVAVTIPDATNVSPGWHEIFASISDASRTRYLYAPEPIRVLSIPQPPTLVLVPSGSSQYQIEVSGPPGETVVLQSSPDLATWQSLATNTLSSNGWDYVDSPSGSTQLFYRAFVVSP